MRLNDMTDEIKKHINFASDCFKYENKILAICWGLQVCSVAAGGKVASGKNGAHIGIASDIEINDEGKKIQYIKIKNLNLHHQHLIMMKYAKCLMVLLYYLVIK